AYVTKSSALSELVQAIRAVVDRRTYLCPEVAGGLASIVRSDDQNKPEARLSGREREVLRLIAEGIRSQPIADRLHISVGTVEVHRRNIMRKLGVRTVADLTRYAIREGLIRA
ncbi:MAG TPA: response regulator transcription factor, partial [Burkholderiaceae bacterium]|nr:response regulator transcription factor [Burkholderiaceae bacterium]